MKTKYEDGILSFDTDSEEEKIFSIIGTKYSDGEGFVRLITEEELKEIIPDVSDWSVPFNELEVGESSTYGYWYYDKATVVVRVA